MVAAIVHVGEDILARHGTEIGGRGYFFYLHEIGHALGLGHPGPYNASARFGADATFANDSWQMTVLSYFDQDENPNIAADFAHPLTPMPADIAAVERLYGPPVVQEGDTIYGEGSTAAGPLSMMLSAPMPTTQTIVNSGGVDWIDLSGDASDARLDLAPGRYSDILGLTGNLAIARGTDIENARAGAGNDNVSGNAQDNVIQTNGGDDTVTGGAGADTFVVAPGDGGTHITDFELDTDLLDLSAFARADVVAAPGSAVPCRRARS